MGNDTKFPLVFERIWKLQMNRLSIQYDHFFRIRIPAAENYSEILNIHSLAYPVSIKHLTTGLT